MIKTNSEIQQIHDKFFHKIFDSLENARDFLEKVLPNYLKERLNLTYIEVVDTKYVSNEFKKGFSDIVVKTKLATKEDEKIPVDLYFLTEHKSDGSVKLFIQILKYMVFEWEKDYNAGKKPRPIIPVVFYHGAEKWDVPKEFAKQFDVDEEIKPYLLNFQYILFDTSPWNFRDKSNQELKENVFLYTAMVLMKVAYTNDIEAIREIFRYWHEKGSTEDKDVILFFMRYISQTQEIKPDRLKEMLDKSKIDGGELMPTLAQQFREEYREEYRKEFMETIGPQLREEGKRNNAVENAKKMLNKGFDIDTIMEITGLGEGEIKKLSLSTTSTTH